MPRLIRRHHIYLILGWLALGLAMIGALLPILPTVPFLIVAAWAFSRSSPRFSHWLYTHPRYGKTLSAWRDHRVISVPAKVAAVLTMAVSVGMAWWITQKLWVVGVQGGVLLVVALYLITRPSHIKSPQDSAIGTNDLAEEKSR